MAMGRDGLIPPRLFAAVHERYGTPWKGTIVTACVVATFASLLPLRLLVPILGILICLLLMLALPAENWLRLIVWLAVGLAIYFGYGRKRSVLARMRAKGATGP